MFFCVQAIEYTLANESFFTAYWTKNYPAYVLSIITQTANIDPTVVEEWYHFAEHKTIFSCSLPAIIMVSISTPGSVSNGAIGPNHFTARGGNGAGRRALPKV